MSPRCNVEQLCVVRLGSPTPPHWRAPVALSRCCQPCCCCWGGPGSLPPRRPVCCCAHPRSAPAQLMRSRALRLGGLAVQLGLLLQDALPDALALGQRDHGLVALANHKHVVDAGGKGVAGCGRGQGWQGQGWGSDDRWGVGAGRGRGAHSQPTAAANPRPHLAPHPSSMQGELQPSAAPCAHPHP